MKAPWVLLGHDEAVEGLRANVSKLQRTNNRQKDRISDLTKVLDRHKEQIARDHRYIDSLEELVSPADLASLKAEMRSRDSAQTVAARGGA